MGGAEGVLVEGFATGGAFTVVTSAVIRGDAGFVIAAWVFVVAGAASELAVQGASAE